MVQTTGRQKFPPKPVSNDIEKTIQVNDLVYVQDKQQGISRIEKNGVFYFYQGNKPVRNKATLHRIKKLAIPPAWKNVWICTAENGHLQATGIDAKNRKQYKYHARWNEHRNQTKFDGLLEFGAALPALRKKIAQDLKLPGTPVEKVLAAIVHLMERTSIRIGNDRYEKLYGSFGLTTLKDKHVKISGNKLQFTFIGKKSIAHRIQLTDKRLAKIIKQCRDIPGKELFQYYDGHGEHKCIDSGMVNQYIQSITGKHFTAKDFRTWIGTCQAIHAFKELEQNQEANSKNDILKVLDVVSIHLGNTRTICRKYYVHPCLIRLHEARELMNHLTKAVKSRVNDLYSVEERLLMALLKSERKISNIK